MNSYDFQNQVRDVVPILDYINQNNPKLVSKIGLGAFAKNKTHEWTEGILAGKRFTSLLGEGFHEGEYIISGSDEIKALGLTPGMKVQTTTSSNVYVIFDNSGSIGDLQIKPVDPNMPALPFKEYTWKVYGAPVTSGSKAGDEVAWQGTTRTNYTQIFRKDASLTGTAVATSTYDNANNMNTQVMAAMELLQSDLNFALWHGRKVLGSGTVPSQLGGLYEFCTDIVKDAKSAALSVDLINSVITDIVKAGGRPNVIAINRALAPALSNLYKDQVIIGEDSNVRGMYVNKIKDAFGNILDVVYDDDLPESHLWIMDINKVKLSPMEGRTFTDKDSTTPGFDGLSRTIIGEYTVEIYNANECFGRIENIG